MPEELPEPQEQPEALTPILEHMLMADQESAAQAATIGEHQLQEQGRTTEAVQGLEPALDHIVKNTVPKAVQDVRIVAPEHDPNALAAAFYQMLRGPQGEQGVVGPEGPQGPEGKPGQDGAAGPPGAQGPQGEAIVGPAGPAGMDGADGLPGAPGAAGAAGKTGPAGKNGKEGSPDTAAQIIEKIRGLFRYEDLKDAPDISKIVRRHVASRDYDLAELKDVDLSGITVGQALKFDGHRWIPFTPAGGTGISVYNEVPTGSATSFSLAHAPLGGTLRLYRGGARQQLGTSSANGDYSLSGLTITFFSAVSAGEVLEADYIY